MSKSSARVRGIEMAYDDTGGSGAALVLLHGFPFDRSMWRGQASALGGECRVVAPDLRGFGETPAGDGEMTMESLAEDVAALLDELKLERVLLGGLSMGGYVAFEFFRKFPERMRAHPFGFAAPRRRAATRRPRPARARRRRGRAGR